MTATCPWCSAPRSGGTTCPRCGADYAKAEQIKAQGRATVAAPAATIVVPPVAVPSGEPDVMEGRIEDPRLELWFCAAGIPAALLLGVLFHLALPGLQRIFLAMPVHELGHAAAAWFCGYFAIPTLWKTITFSESRDFIAPVALFGALGFLIFKAHVRENRALLALGIVLLALQATGTFFVKARTAQMLIVFGGDGFGMVLATALMATFFFGKTTQIYRGSLRWGFLAIGAGAFADMFGTWWAARSDFGAVPFGEMEGVGLSDATKLVDWYNWPTEVMIRRYVALGLCCLAVLAAVYAWGVWRALKSARERARSA